MHSTLLAGNTATPVVAQMNGDGLTLHQGGNTVSLPSTELARLVAVIDAPTATTPAKAAKLLRYPARTSSRP